MDRAIGHEGDVDVALSVFDGLGRLRSLDRSRAEHPRVGHRSVDLGELLDDLGVLPCDDLCDAIDRVLAVARIDALGTIAQTEIVAS